MQSSSSGKKGEIKNGITSIGGWLHQIFESARKHFPNAIRDVTEIWRQITRGTGRKDGSGILVKVAFSL